MARQFDFEEKVYDEHPEDMHDLARATSLAGDTMNELDELVNRKMGGPLTFEEYTRFNEEHRELVALALDAWRLRQALRAYGEKQLAAWEAARRAQQLVTGHEGQ